jgi:putative ABC transport system substrate-binding protein
MKSHHIFFVIFTTILGMTWAADASKLPLVVITQIVEHEALNKEKEGIIAALKDAGFEDGKTVTILYASAQGNVAIATQIATNFASKNPNVAVGISTPSAQSLIQPMAKHGIPVVFAAVTDPIEARLVSSLDKHSENVTGVSDGLPLKPQLELIKQLLPNVKAIGILYNPGEANSAKAFKTLEVLAREMGFIVEEATTTKTADTLMAATSLIGKAQLIFIPNDNTAMASVTSVVALGLANKMPVITPDVDSVKQGILAVKGASHFAMGYKAGQMVAQILKGENAANIPVAVDHPLDLAINKKSADVLQITIPDGLKKEAQFVG